MPKEASKPSSPGAGEREIPRGNLQGFVKYLRYDLLSGFLVFLTGTAILLANHRERVVIPEQSMCPSRKCDRRP